MNIQNIKAPTVGEPGVIAGCTKTTLKKVRRKVGTFTTWNHTMETLECISMNSFTFAPHSGI